MRKETDLNPEPLPPTFAHEKLFHESKNIHYLGLGPGENKEC